MILSRFKNVRVAYLMKIITCKCFFITCLVLFYSISRAQAQVVFPLKISDNNRYLIDQQNKPFPILGRTAWFILSQPESGYKRFLENTLAHGHNAIEFAAIMHWPMGNHAPFNGEGEMPFLKRLNGDDWNGILSFDSLLNGKDMPDLQTPNEKYWVFVDQFIGYCESRDIVAFMFPAYLGYNGQEQGWMKELVANGNIKTEAYGAWIANRYKARKNIVWMLLGDIGNLNEEQLRAENALIKGLKSVKGQSEQYSAESHSGENATDNIHVGHEMTLNGVYTWELKIPVPHLARRGYDHSPTMPAFLLEEPYDEEGSDGNKYNPNATQPVRRFQWWGWLSTIGGYISGNGYVWPFVDPIWQQHLDTQGALDMARLNRFVQSVEWWKLIPSGLNGMKTLVIDSDNVATSNSYIAAAAAKDGSILVAYIPPAHTGGEVTIDRSGLNNKVNSYWFDPTSGDYTLIQDPPQKESGIYTFTIPGKNSNGENDWVLVLMVK
jgi:hypothetical protein